MNKSKLIATCLVEANLINDIQSGEDAVESIFAEYFPAYSFSNWNTELTNDVINYYIKIARNSTTIRVDSFIRDLWDE